MRCSNCPALYRQEYGESYDVDEWCGIGMSEDDMTEFSDGTTGCRLPRNRIIKLLKEGKCVWQK